MAMNDYSDNDYWKALAERFFEAGTSEEEERELRRFIASGLAGSEFNDVRAVMGLAAVGARRYNRRRRRTVFLSAAAAAAVVAVAVVPLPTPLPLRRMKALLLLRLATPTAR